MSLAIFPAAMVGAGRLACPDGLFFACLCVSLFFPDCWVESKHTVSHAGCVIADTEQQCDSSS